jgi:hypothetical protein
MYVTLEFLKNAFIITKPVWSSNMRPRNFVFKHTLPQTDPNLNIYKNIKAD